MIKQKQLASTAAATVVAVIFGFSFLFTKEALNYLTPFQLLGLRFAFAALTLTLLAAFKIIRLTIKLADIPDLLKIALWQPVLYFVCETYGVKYTSASESGVIIALVPVAVAILSYLVLKEQISYQQLIFIGAAVIGVILMSSGKAAVEYVKFQTHLAGIGFLFCAVLAAGFYNIFSRRASRSHAPMDITFIMMWTGALVFNSIGIIQSYLGGHLLTYYEAFKIRPVVYALIYLGLLSSVAAFFLLNYALSNLPASRTAVFMNLTPIVSVLAGVVFLNEIMNTWQVIGGLMVLLGVWGTNKYALPLLNSRS